MNLICPSITESGIPYLQLLVLVELLFLLLLMLVVLSVLFLLVLSLSLLLWAQVQNVVSAPNNVIVELSIDRDKNITGFGLALFLEKILKAYNLSNYLVQMSRIY